MGLGKKEVISIVADYCKSNKKASIIPNGEPGKRWCGVGFFEMKPTNCYEEASITPNCKGKGRLT